jgi:hypothetical protein
VINLRNQFITPAISSLLLEEIELLPQNESINFSIDFLKGDEYDKNIESTLQKFDGIQCEGDEIKIYRAICHAEDDLPLSKLGICWSWEQKKAYCYGCKHAENFYYVYHALCKPQSINWPHTVQKKFSLYGHEQEIKMIPGEEIRVYKIEKRRRTLETLLETHDVNYKAII